jgi:hypothetical protein
MFSPQEDKLLFSSARNRRLRAEFDVAKDYGDKSDAVQAEEAVDRAAEVPGKFANDPKLIGLLDRIHRFFERLGNKIPGIGLQTLEDVVDTVGLRARQVLSSHCSIATEQWIDLCPWAFGAKYVSKLAIFTFVCVCRSGVGFA